LTAVQDVQVRQAVFADLEALALLFDAYRQFQGRRSDLFAAHAFLRARFGHGESIVFLAQASGHALGFAQLYPSYSSVSLKRIFVLNDLFVDPGARGRGIASRLLKAVEAHAWTNDAARVTLSVARDNDVARAIYEAKGWLREEGFCMYHRFPSGD